MKGESVDLVIHNAQIHTLNEKDEVHEAIAIKDGKIVEVGPERQILNKYSADEYIDVEGKDIYPGWIDAHGHMLSYAKQKLSVDLVGCSSYDEMIVRIEKYQSKYNRKFIIGRGWDQSLWGDVMPTNDLLNEKFPDIPVCLFRIDGHALLANDLLIQRSDVFSIFHANKELNQGGHYEVDTVRSISSPEFSSEPHIVGTDGHIGVIKPTGVFVDNAMTPIIERIPDFPKKELTKALMAVQREMLMYGITGVHEAGMLHQDFQLFDRLVDKGDLKVNVYGMLLPTKENIAFARKNGIYRNNNLYVRSFKVYGDGALGSRGAFLKQPYADKHDHHGYLTTSMEHMEQIAEICHATGYQMNTHAIGDSTNRLMLELYQNAYELNPDHRWRIEHAQIVDPKDFHLFAQAGVFPSVQPTHATSDMRWAESRIGAHRMAGAYAYNSIYKEFGMVALGTDFPVEPIDPFRTINSAVNRKDAENKPSDGFGKNESLTFKNCMKGMTFWAAMASFQENELGTIEKGKDATLSIFVDPVLDNGGYQKNFAYMVFIKGKKVYSVE
jgi:predicted amidohydrolase YtcJ